MGSESYRTVTFQQLLDDGVLAIGDGYRAKNSELGGEGLAFLRAGHVNDSNIDFSGVERFHEELTPRLSAKVAKAGDTIVTTKGNSTGRTSFVTSDMPTFVYSPHLSFWRTRDERLLDSRFLRYWSLGREFTDQLSGMKTSTDMAPYLSLTDQRRLRITLPPPPTQRAIGRILGTLDDKIELNRRMNETLEAMARAIFKSWFVEFDPVRAKADGRQPTGMDPATAALFPDSFEDSPLGKIPNGWRTCTIRDLASSIQYGLTQSASIEPVGPQFLRITDIQGGRIDWSTVPFCKVAPEEHSRYRLIPGDVLVARTGASTGENVYLARVPDAVFASYLVRFQFSDAGLARLVGAFMRTTAYHDYVAGCLGGSAQPNASAQVLAGAELVVPPTAIASRFTDALMPIDERLAVNSDESRALASIRDTLLPRLLSGKIRLTKRSERISKALG